jgi:AAA+ superfamily predicted ATPase
MCLVFLRKIEYFEGLLFLTTNQIHIIDKAFESRVTLGIKFRELDPHCREEIWRKVLDDLPSESEAECISSEDKTIKEWGKSKLNGRQIRNVVQSALLLGKARNREALNDTLVDECLQDMVDFMKMIQKEKERVELEYLPHWS